MDLLSRLIPGVRDLRVPLTVGYAWSFTLWLSFADEVPRTGDVKPGTLVDAIYRISSEIGAVGRLAALSLVAYLVGSVAEDVHLLVLRRRSMGRTKGRLGYQRRRAWTARVSQWAEEARWFNDKKWQQLGPTFDELARTQSEARLRLQIVPPLVLAALVLAVMHSTIVLAVAVFGSAVLLGWHGLYLLQEAFRLIALIDHQLGEEFDTWQEYIWEQP